MIRIVVIVCYFRCSVKTLDAMCGSTLVVCLFQIKLQKVLFQPLQMFFTVNSVDLIVPTRKYNLLYTLKDWCYMDFVLSLASLFWACIVIKFFCGITLQ